MVDFLLYKLMIFQLVFNYQRVGDFVNGVSESTIQWIGFLGKIYTGKPWRFFHEKITGLSDANFSLKLIH